MRLQTPEDVQDMLAESLVFAREEPTDQRVEAACDAYTHLVGAESLNASVFIAGYKRLIEGSDWSHTITHASPVRTLAGSIDGYLMPPPAMLTPYMDRALELSTSRAPFETADFMTKLHPFYKGNGVAARLLFLALSERNRTMYQSFDEQDIREILQVQRAWVSESYPRANGKSLDQYYAGKAAGWPWSKILDLELGGR